MSKEYLKGLLKAREIANKRIEVFRAIKSGSKYNKDIRGAKIKSFEYYIQLLDESIKEVL